MASTLRHSICAGLSALALSAAAIDAARATEGYFVEGTSAREQAIGGAGSADPADALTIANNPAGLVDVGRQFNGGVSLFNPNRQYNSTGATPGFAAPGTVDSYRNLFAIPALGYSQPFTPDSAFGVAMTANGGMDTNYAGSTYNPTCAYYHLPQQGVFCGGRAGVDLQQALITAGYAQRFGAVSVGIAPVMAVQVFSAYGISTFGAFGLSSNPAELSDRSPAWSVGGGVRGGALWHVTDALSLSATGVTPMWSSKFQNYSGLFAQDGNFNIPGAVGAGLSYKVMPTLALMFDYKHIFYHGVNSIGDPMTAPYLLGTANGPGFGWKDVDVFAFGAEWKYSDLITLRLGYAYNTEPITANNVTFNILAPGVVTSHISGGLTFNVDHNSAIDVALVYAPRTSVSGPEITPMGPSGRTIDLAMSQLVFTLGYTYHFDTPAPVIAKF